MWASYAVISSVMEITCSLKQQITFLRIWFQVLPDICHFCATNWLFIQILIIISNWLPVYNATKNPCLSKVVFAVVDNFMEKMLLMDVLKIE